MLLTLLNQKHVIVYADGPNRGGGWLVTLLEQRIPNRGITIGIDHPSAVSGISRTIESSVSDIAVDGPPAAAHIAIFFQAVVSNIAVDDLPVSIAAGVRFNASVSDVATEQLPAYSGGGWSIDAGISDIAVDDLFATVATGAGFDALVNDIAIEDMPATGAGGALVVVGITDVGIEDFFATPAVSIVFDAIVDDVGVDDLGATTSGVWGYFVSGILDDLVALTVQPDDDLIRSIFESDAPVFAESHVNYLRTVAPTPVEVNEEGLWVRNVDHGDTFGVYGGGSSKSWAGTTLYPGDLVIGRVTAGVIHWHSGNDAGDPVYFGNPRLEIGNAKLAITFSGTNRIVIDPDNLYLSVGDPAPSAYGNNGIWFGDDGGVYKAWIGNTSSYMRWNGTQIEVRGSINITGGSGIGNFSDAGALATQNSVNWNTQVTGSGKPENNATYGASWGSNLSGIPARFGDVPSGIGLFLTSSHMGYYTSGAWKTFMDNSGNFYLGGTSGVFQYNASTSDLLVGNDAGANMFWHQSEGRLEFREGTGTVNAYVDSDGKFYAAGGNLKIDAGSISVLASTDIHTIVNPSNGYMMRSSDDSIIGALYGVQGIQNYVILTAPELPGKSNQILIYSDVDSSSQAITTIQAQSGVESAAISLFAYAPNADAYGQFTGDYFEFESTVRLRYIDATPPDPLNSSEVYVYLKNKKLVFQFNDSGTIRYKYLDLSGVGVTWVHTTTPP